MDLPQIVVLQCGPIRLEPLSPSQSTSVQDAVRQMDPQSWAYLTQSPLAGFDAWFDAMLSAMASGKQHIYTVWNETQAQLVGSTRYANIEPDHARLEISTTWYIPSARGTSVNPACKFALMEYAFETLGCRRVELKCDALNERSRRAIRKLGATEEGILREHMNVPDGKGGRRQRDTVYHSVIASEWPQVKGQLHQRMQQAA